MPHFLSAAQCKKNQSFIDSEDRFDDPSKKFHDGKPSIAKTGYYFSPKPVNNQPANNLKNRRDARILRREAVEAAVEINRLIPECNLTERRIPLLYKGYGHAVRYAANRCKWRTIICPIPP
jgi:hypothetical protein